MQTERKRYTILSLPLLHTDNILLVILVIRSGTLLSRRLNFVLWWQSLHILIIHLSLPRLVMMSYLSRRDFYASRHGG